MLARFSDPNSPSSLAATEALEQFIHIAKEQAITLGIVIFAYSSNHEYSSSSLDFLVERVLVLCEKHAITCLALRNTFAPYQEDKRQLWVNQFDHHPGALANRLIADRLLETFGEVWLRR